MKPSGASGLLGDSSERDYASKLIERLSPVDSATEHYVREAVFRGYWGEKIRSFLTPGDWHQLAALTDPDSAEFCLGRPDFHFIQTYTLTAGVR